MPQTDQTASQGGVAPAAAVPVSGRYDGAMSLPQPGQFALDLRVDIDAAVDNSPVMKRVSGDLFQVTQSAPSGQPPLASRTYIESWIVDDPQVKWSSDHVDIEGGVRFWTASHPATTAAIAITWDGATQARTATVTLTESGGSQRSFTCRRISECFRSVTLDTAICSSVNAAPLSPRYDTHWHDDRPGAIAQRTLDIVSAYREAGVDVAIGSNVAAVDDSAPQFKSWTVAELHDAMETHFSRYGGQWPNWAFWGFMAGTCANSAIGGLMFDAAAADGHTSGPEPERRGFAVFRNHDWFRDLVAGPPRNQDQAAAMRQFLYTWVHEAGHTFNFVHSWDRARPDALTWMNYDWKYDQRNGADAFWKSFAFRFADDELIHLRHGNRASVIMGGDPWSSDPYLQSPNLAMAQTEGAPPLELLIRARPYFEFMEPILIEVRLRNLLAAASVVIEKELAPEYGGLAVFIQKPDRRVVKYDPVVCAIGTSATETLAPPQPGQQGEDRFSREIFISYGASGFYFDQPGEYCIRAVYQGRGDVLITSNTLHIRIGSPITREANRLAQDYFSHQVGLSLYLQGSRSPFLKNGAAVLQDLADRYKKSLLGANIAMALANGQSLPFFRVGDPQSGKLTMSARANPKEALKLTNMPLQVLRASKDRLLNLAYARVVRRRAQYHEAAGMPGRAKQELVVLQRDLAKRGVNPPVIAGYAALATSIGSRRTRRRSR